MRELFESKYVNINVRDCVCRECCRLVVTVNINNEIYQQ